jgi:hypothetical protein
VRPQGHEQTGYGNKLVAVEGAGAVELGEIHGAGNKWLGG